MTANRILETIFKRDLSTRERVILFVTVLTLMGAFIYQVPYRLLNRSIANLAASRIAGEEEIRAMSLQIADIKAHEAELRAGLKSGVPAWQLVDQRGVIVFLDDIASGARRQGVNLIAVHPTQEVVKDKYKEISMNLDVKGRYRDLASYFKHLENLARIVSIRKLRIEACPDSASACATQFEAVTYMEK